MAHLLETYARTTGLRINEIELPEHYFPLNFEKYIVVCSSSGMPAKNYDYFNEVLAILKPKLNEQGYKIIQVGGKEDEILLSDLILLDKTSQEQLFYIIKHSTLVLSNDTSILHVAGHYNKKIVSVFGITMPEISGSYFGDRENQIYLTPDFSKQPPSFNPNEKPKRINAIKPEEIIKAVCKLLNISFNCQHKTIFIGENYKVAGIEMIPNCNINPQGKIINLRLDKGGSEDFCLKQLTLGPCQLVIKDKIDIEKFKQVNGNINGITLFVDKHTDFQFLKELSRLGIKIDLVTYLSKEEVDKIRLDFADYGIIKRAKENKKPEGVTAKTKFQSNRIIISNTKVYLSFPHWERDREVDLNNRVETVIDDPDFWLDLNFFYLYH